MAVVHAPQQGALQVVYPKSGYTPAVGDLVIYDTAGDFQVDKLADDEVPTGIVRRLLGDGSTALVIERFTSGAVVYLPYSGSVTMGYTVLGDGSNKVKCHASNGIGKVIANANLTGQVVVAF